jgi:hypothetical protein
MPKAICFTGKRKEEALRHLENILSSVEIVREELRTGKHEPMYIPPREMLFNAAVASEHLQMMFGKKVL